MSKRKRSSQADIAQALDVSISTVSRALADSPSITEHIRRKVRDCALELGYPIKLRLQIERFDAILVCMSITDSSDFNESPTSIYYEVLNSIRDEAGKFSVGIETLMIPRRARIPADVMARLGPKTGVVLLGVSPTKASLDELLERGIAVVMANGIEDDLRVDSVTPANFISGAILARHLRSMGHRRFLYLSWRERLTLQRRFAGFRQQVEDGTERDPSTLVSSYRLSEAEISSGGSADGFLDWLDRHRGEATALVCFNDRSAAWALETARSVGFSIPDELSVTGFDDLPISCLTTPLLTTFRFDWGEVGAESVRMLHRRLSNPDSRVRFVQIGGELIVRKSVRDIGEEG